MRDVLIVTIVFGVLPFILWRPYIGVLLWSWLGYMNPHRLAYGFAFSFPFSQIVGLVTLIALVLEKNKPRIPFTALTIVWVLFIVWMNVTTIYALNPEAAGLEWERAMKIQLFSAVTIFLMHEKKRINYLIWVIVASLAYFGVKGGIFSILTGGEFRVWGPRGSFIEGNNEIGLAMTMIVPMIWYLYLQAKPRWLKLMLVGALLLTVVAILTTHSRGALLAIAAMALFLLFTSRHKLWLATFMIIGAPILWASMPQHWHDRMATIETYEEDESAMGRINAWWFAVNLANDRPIVGGGYSTFTPQLFQKYAPEPDDFHDAHSVYFEILGEHGYPGLALFLSIGVCALRSAGKVAKKCRDDPERVWASDLASMLQVSLVAYAVGGMFLGLAYFDLYYHIVVIIIILASLTRSPAEEMQPARADATQGFQEAVVDTRHTVMREGR